MRIRRVTAAEIYEMIVDHAKLSEERNDVHQQPYKHDFFLIFRLAFANKLCGTKVPKPSASKRKKATSIQKAVIDEEVIEQLLRKTLRKTDDNSTIIQALRDWWEAWTYAWDHHPNKSPFYRKRPVSHPVKSGCK